MNNLLIRIALLKTGLRNWQLANILEVSEPTLYRKLRHELPEEEQKRIAELIEMHAKNGGISNEQHNGN